ncbi:uncharacterized protein LOC131657702 [Vicia villosa]|uniref:uncharacterized protein LOC131657702 n=1 Tax=Vicia villosa TaxID=3911 RepID=UPI00273C1D73|nr:uncharacterized protein LOC131657702 [Vicia villosa]
MDVRFSQISSDLSTLNTRLDNEKVVEDSRYESLMAILTKISLQKELQQAMGASSTTVHGTVNLSGTVHGTVNPAVTVHGSVNSAGIILNPSSIPRVSTPVSHVISPSHTPIRHSATFSTTNPHPTPTRNLTTPIPSHFPPYPPIPSILSSIQPFNIPLSQPIPFHQIPQPISYPNLSHIPPLPPMRTPKLELPMFDGAEPLDWLFQADQFFNFYNMPPENRMSLISFYMKGDALSWFKWMHQSHLLSDWFSFTKALELRFGPSTFDNHQAELFKLKQDGSVVDYQTKFEKLGNQVVGLPPDAILNCFISGLSSDIRNEMAIHKPTSISQAIGLAKLIESKLKDSKPKFNKPFASQYLKPTASPAGPIPKPQTSPTFLPSRTIPKLQTNPTPSKFPIKRLSQAQLQERRAQGLCFNCDDKFVTGHKCSTSRFLLLMAEEDPIDDQLNATEFAEIESEPELQDTYFQLSTQALTGQFSPQTLKYKGFIKGFPVSVLIDTGSTHNIMQPRIAHHLNLTATPITQFLVMANFSIPSITFNHNNQPMTLTGDPKSLPTSTTFHQFRQLVHTDAIASLHLMFLQPMDSNPPPNNITNLQVDNSSSELPVEISHLLQRYNPIFQQPKGLPPNLPHDHHITLIPHTPPVNVKPYRYPHSQKDAMTKLIQEIALNAVTVKDRFPIPTIDELLDELNIATIFSKLDLRSGYHQIRVASEDTYKTAFRTFDGHYEFLLSKCVFAAAQIDYLGHVISASNVAPDPEKIKAIVDWPQPRSLTTLRGFLGLTGFYRRFVRNYATLAAPLTDLLRSTIFSWSTEAQLAFTTLKHKMTDMPVLALPDFTQIFTIETDASGVAIGVVLSQAGHPIAFFSKKLCPRMQQASAYVREMYAITESIKKWRQYLVGQHFHIYTDQKSLKSLILQKIQTPEQQKWTSKLQGFNFDVFYKPGRSNLVADALSRQFPSDASLPLIVSSPVPDILHKLQQFYATTIEGQHLMRQNQDALHTTAGYRIKRGLLYYKDKLFVPNLFGFRDGIFHEYHSTSTSSHSGVKATVSRISNSFAWPGLYGEVKQFVKHCSTCQHNKYITQKKGLLQPLPIPHQVWEDLTMDFVIHLPNSFGHTVIWVICDRLSKFVHFLALPTKFTAKDLASRFAVEIFRLHGTPRSIVSDRDPLFLSTFWKTFFKVHGTSLNYSTAYHPETDRQTKVVNRSLEM